MMTPRASPTPKPAAAGPQAVYSDDEQAAVRRAFRLPAHADMQAWCGYARAMATWRQRVHTWLVVFLASPAEYLRRTTPKTKAHPADWREAYETARAQVLDLAQPGQRPVEVAWEIMAPGNRAFLSELVNAGWLPARPLSPNSRPRRPAVSDDQRMRDAARLAEAL